MHMRIKWDGNGAEIGERVLTHPIEITIFFLYFRLMMMRPIYIQIRCVLTYNRTFHFCYAAYTKNTCIMSLQCCIHEKEMLALLAN